MDFRKEDEYCGNIWKGFFIFIFYLVSIGGIVIFIGIVFNFILFG